MNPEEFVDVIKEVVWRNAVFGFLCVLDGVSAIEGIGKKGVLKLYYEKDGDQVLLNDHSRFGLHELL